MALSLTNYVKFLRGTPSAYQSLENKDKDTLYFICETDATSGILYLGDKKIGDGNDGGEGGSTSSVVSIEDLEDVLIGADIDTDNLLVYDAEQSAWINKPLAEVIISDIAEEFAGATDLEDGISGLVPAPAAGQNNYFLRGDGQWAEVPVTNLTDIEDKLNTLIGEDIDKSVNQIIVEALIPESAKESLDTLNEIASWIQDHPDDVAQINADLKSVKGAVFDTESEEGIITQGLVTKVANLEAILNGSEDEAGVISDLTDLQSAVADLQDDVATLDERMQWQDM